MKTVIYILTLLILTGCADEKKLVSPVKFDGKYGFLDTNGDWHLKPTFDSLGIFYNGYADSYIKGKNGIINSRGKTIIENKYDFIGHFENKRALVLINDQYNFVDLKGELISKEFFFDAEDFSEGMAAVQFDENGKWGYINEKGELKIDTLYDYADVFEDGNGLAEVGDLELLINKNGEIIDTIVSPGLSFKKYKVTGSSDFGTLGKVNMNGDTIMSNKYSSFGYVQEDKFWFKEKNKFGIADTTGKILIQPIYEDLSYFCDNGFARAKKESKYGFIDDIGNTVIEFKFEDVGGFKYGLAAAKFNGKWGFIDEKGDFAIEPKYERIGHQFRPINAKSESLYNYQLNY